MNDAPDPWPDIERDDPEEFDRLLRIFRLIAETTEGLQAEIACKLLEKPRFKAHFEKEAKGSESAQMDKINHAIKAFVGVMPLALSNGVNPILSALSAHSALIGDPLVSKLIARLNEQTLADPE